MPDAESTRRLIEALEVYHNAKVGFGAGFVLAAVAYLYRVAELGGPVPATRGSPALFLVLAVVLAASVGALFTLALTVRTAVGLTRDAE